MARRKSKKNQGRFAGVPIPVMDTRKYAALSSWGVKLLLDLAYQYKGNNNGDLHATWSILRYRGWNSKGTLDRATKELLSVGFISRTRQGGRNKCSLFALTWQPVDPCTDKRTNKSKLDVVDTIVPSRLWRDDVDADNPG